MSTPTFIEMDVPLLDETGRFPDHFAPQSVVADKNAAAEAAAAALASENAAELAETGASASAQTATTQAQTATAQAGIATTKASLAESARAAAVIAQGLAETAANASSVSAAASDASADSAAVYAGQIFDSIGEAEVSNLAAQAARDAALASKNAAELAETHAETAETNASASAAAALASQNASASSAGTATTQAGTATTKAGEASASATAALASQNSATASAGTATTKAGEASASAAAALASQNSATASAATATTKAGEASTSAATATTQAGISTTKASEASASAAAALASQNSAAATLAGAVTKATIDAKGDLLVGSANDTIVRLAVGENGALPVADSNQAAGIGWQSPIPLLRNLLGNSDFSNGTTGWAGSNATLTNVGNALVATCVDGALDFTSVAPPAFSSIAAGRMIYAAVTITAHRTHNPRIWGGTTSFASPNSALAGVASRVSWLVTTPTSINSLPFYTNGASGTDQVTGSVTTFDNAILIDLTAAFGAGLEPTKAEMDAYMARYPNSWFADTSPQLWSGADWLKRTQNACRNLIPNSDLSAGPAGWGGVFGSIAATGGVISLTGDGTNPFPYSYSPVSGKRQGQVVYVAIQMRVPAANTSATSVSMNFGGAAMAVEPTPTPGTWYTLSGRATLATTGADANLTFSSAYADAATAAGKVTEAKYAIAIDLTATFGAGNEPTKTEMDYLLSLYPNNWFGGTVNDLVTRRNIRDRIGSGSPEGVVTAPVGTSWTDILDTRGATKWVKKTGTGNTGWKVTVGDTGWRDVSSLLVSGLVVSSSIGVCKMSRVGDVVRFAFKLDVSAGSISTILASGAMPVGFRPSGHAYMWSTLWTATTAGALANSLTTSRIGYTQPENSSPLAVNGTTPFPNPGTIAWTGEYVTADPWPTVLPGS